MLYNLNDLNDHSAYIVVGDQTNYWRDNKLFIFDDTLLHQSFNETEQTRYCMFVDIVRPSPFPRLMGAAVTLVGLVCRSVHPRFYHPWTVLGR